MGSWGWWYVSQVRNGLNPYHFWPGIIPIDLKYIRWTRSQEEKAKAPEADKIPFSPTDSCENSLFRSTRFSRFAPSNSKGLSDLVDKRKDWLKTDPGANLGVKRVEDRSRTRQPETRVLTFCPRLTFRLIFRLPCRLKLQNLQIIRPPAAIGRYTMIKHDHRKESPSSVRQALLRMAKRRASRDGLSSVKYKLKSKILTPLYTHLLIEIDRIHKWHFASPNKLILHF